MPMQVSLNLFMMQLSLPEKLRILLFLYFFIQIINSFSQLKSLATIVAAFSRYCFALEQLKIYFPEEYVVRSYWLL